MTLHKQPPLALDEILARLNALADPVNVAGQQRFGIRAAGQLGVSMPPARRARRVAEGCIVVEMEASAFFALAQFRGVTCGQVVYGGDLVSPEGWDFRDWVQRGDVRTALFWLAVEACSRLG